MAFLPISIVSIIITALLFGLSFWLTVWKGDEEKLSPYESGFEPLGDARLRFAILYWIIGILYLILDLEIIFIFPIATTLFQLNNLISIWAATLFLIILSLGFIYEVIKGGLKIKD